MFFRFLFFPPTLSCLLPFLIHLRLPLVCFVCENTDLYVRAKNPVGKIKTYDYSCAGENSAFIFHLGKIVNPTAENTDRESSARSKVAGANSSSAQPRNYGGARDGVALIYIAALYPTDRTSKTPTVRSPRSACSSFFSLCIHATRRLDYTWRKSCWSKAAASKGSSGQTPHAPAPQALLLAPRLMLRMHLLGKVTQT